DNTLIYVQNWNADEYYKNTDSWIIIEHLDENFETISELYYTSGEDEIYTFVNSIVSTKEEDLLLVGHANSLNGDKSWNFVTKFPASAFDPDNIEEAHAHNLHLAVAYPNPGGDVMNIRTGLRNATLQVYDMQGRKIHKQEITDDVTSVDASNWQRGTYVWELGTGNGNGNRNGSRILESGKWVKD
ncbi:MAG: T9SS type A sorting domain-containing protein, partial [Lentimicrobiaceae bacterium]|nr:T9SS type A sorting domain-containing protein [Lentimicrobiaceae bacterium]